MFAAASSRATRPPSRPVEPVTARVGPTLIPCPGVHLAREPAAQRGGSGGAVVQVDDAVVVGVLLLQRELGLVDTFVPQPLALAECDRVDE